MATLQPVMTSSRRAIIFGSQGSSSIFSAATARRAEDDAQQSAARALLLSRCHTAFLEDCLSLDVESRRSININLADFHDQKSLLVPIQSFHGNPTIQATTICLYQLLHYLAEVDRSGLDPQDLTDQILETTGICSGLLPATVVAASKTLESFISFGVAAFRLAFWIAFRSVRYGYAIENASNTGTSWSLVVLGLSRSELEEKLEEFKKQVSWIQCSGFYVLEAVLIFTGISDGNPSLCHFKSYSCIGHWPQQRLACISGRAGARNIN